MVRVRFAPSPTGFLHIGGARTYAFNWLFARNQGGTVILRIDDTDVERSTEESLRSIYEGLSWLELPWDEEYRQSERKELHQKLANTLFEKGFAYRDFTPLEQQENRSHESGPWLCNPEMRALSREESDRRAAAGEPFVLRFRVPRESRDVIRFHDIVYGEQVKSLNDIEDFALLRSDGSPTYHTASCADDLDLKITHIIRGQDHLTNTFKHILIFEAVGAELPEFAHLPLLIAPDGSKLSKRRHGRAVSVQTYQEHGFLPHAFVNFLALLGWSPKDNREYMTLEELIEAFNLKGVNRSNARVNFTEEDPIDPKALWLNSQHLRLMPVEKLLPYVERTLQRYGLPVPCNKEWFKHAVEALRTRFSTLNDFPTKARAYFADDYEIDPQAMQRLQVQGARQLLHELADRLETLDDYNKETVEAELRKLAEERGVKAGVIINAARAILTGQPVGPGIFDVFELLGKDRAIERLRKA